MEQPPVQPAVRLRPATARREFRRRHPGSRRTIVASPQNGPLRLQPLLPSPVRQPSGQTSHRHTQRRPLQRHEVSAGLYVPRRGQRRPGQADGLPARRRESAHQGPHRGERGEMRHHNVIPHATTEQPAPFAEAATEQTVRQQFQHAGQRAPTAQKETGQTSETVRQFEWSR